MNVFAAVPAPLKRGTCALAAVLLSAPAFSATLPVAWSWTSPDGTSIVASDGIGATTSPPVPGSYDFSHTISASDAVHILPGSISVNHPLGFEFYDDYIFNVTGAIANVVSSTISLSSLLGIENLQARLFEYAPPPSLPYIGPPPLGTLIEAWSSPLNCGPGCTGEVVVLDDVVLNAGTYVLQIRGIVSGTVSGSYGGALNLVPIPVPGALWLFGSALALGGLLRRRKLTDA